ncbi:MAG: hypothetical protein H8D97_01565 [Proteobacteria bacterium]|nr:hypothetical protein [Pseudomonadota bacterium]
MTIQFNESAAKYVLSNNTTLKSALKSSKREDQLLSKAFEVIGKLQSKLKFDVVTIKADVSIDSKGENELKIQMGNFGDPKSLRQYELTYSKRMNTFAFDEEKPTMR